MPQMSTDATACFDGLDYGDEHCADDCGLSDDDEGFEDACVHCGCCTCTSCEYARVG